MPNNLNIDEAKKIVLEKHPDAEIHEYGISVVCYSATEKSFIGSARVTEDEAWLSAAQNIQTKKDKVRE